MSSYMEGAFLLVWLCFSMLVGVKGVEMGKVNIQQVGNEDFRCIYVSFRSRFSSGTPMRVFASINYGNDSSEVHDSAFVWVEDVTTSRVKVCLVQGGGGSVVNTTIDWFAFQGSQSGVHHGETSFSRFTTGTKCNRVAFPQAFSAVPKLHVTVKHGTSNQKQDAMSVWIANISTSRFEVCLQESRTFDGPHSNIMVNWMTYEQYPSAWKAKESSLIVFSENELPTPESNYALCKNVSFTSPFYSPPVILTTVLNGDSNSSNKACPVKGPLSSWLEEVTNTHFRVCIRDSAGYDGQRSNVIVDYLVIGDLDPCTNASCKYYSHCVASSPRHFTCVCENSCPSYEEQVCASNGRTFNNLCLLRKEICRTSGNYTDYHPGSCTGFPLQKGRHTFQNIPYWAEDQCEIIKFKPFIFYPDQKIYLQLTVNHINYSDSAVVHEATTPWVESVNSTQFTACVTRAGRNDYPTDSFATIDWVAYQGAPSGGVAGEEMFSRWWTGTTCQTVTFPKGKYSHPPTIFATAEHHRLRLKHDATSVWLEDVSARSFKICVRELQNFAGVHDDISVNWLAFEFLHRPLFAEHDDVSFENKGVPSENHNFAFCQDLSFIRNYTKAPTVVLTAKHSTSGGNAAAECNGIVSWIEFITKSGFRICVKELFVKRFDPLAVSYAVLSDVCPDDWTYFKGYCYRKVSSCDSWNGGQETCTALEANLPSIHSQEENVYVQSLHGGEHSWLGLSDINSEGTFVWSDGTLFDFHYWAKHQPNNFHNEDCVHTLGFLEDHKYQWNDINCTDCHRFTCKRDYNECKHFSYDCPVNATCVNNNGSYWCQCPVGYRLDGKNCTDIDECTASARVCDVNASCQNTLGSYLCSCKAGYRGDGKTCTAFSAVFTHLGTIGRYGPTTLGSHYTGQNHDGQVTLSSGIQKWTVPYTGDYRIETVGAAGGYGTYSNNGLYRGRGARMIGTFILARGEIVRILVGQEGGINHADYAAGGGGGTFVVRGSNTSLIVAGGGGGIEQAQSRHVGCDASTGTTGNPGYRSWSGGNNGHGADTADYGNSGGGGGGFYSSGRSSRKFGGIMGYGGEGGKGFLQGGVGGRALGNNAVGGFGGGGGAYGIGGGGGAGGGGGYSGGSSGDNEYDSCGGGGGSYNAGTNQQNECCYKTAGHGQVTITLLQ